MVIPVTDTLSILYVDDDPGLLEVGKLILERSGQFSVEPVTSAKEALALLRIKNFCRYYISTRKYRRKSDFRELCSLFFPKIQISCISLNK